jgi:glutaredoxin
MLGTAWCEYCKLARKFFKENGVRVEEIDADTTTDPILRSMYRTDGVPQFDVENLLIKGFLEPEIRARLCLPRR